MLVMGTDTGGLTHPDWQENLALGLKLQAQLERQAPGITRALSLRSQRFNQDLTRGSLLIEMGAAGNSHAEALRAAEQLAGAIIALAKGTQQSPAG
jgi:stage II sporulation protein P